MEIREHQLRCERDKKQYEEQCKNTFKPLVKTMISEKNLQQRQIDDDQLRSIAPECKIPLDSIESREKFKNVPGMAKFLQKQYNAMIKREEAKVIEYNVGKIKEQKLSLDQVIKPNYAYIEHVHGQGDQAMEMPQQMQQAQMYQQNPQTVNGTNFVPAPFGASPSVEVSNFQAITAPQDGTNNLNNHLSFGDEYDQID